MPHVPKESQFEGVESENERKTMEIYPGDPFNLLNYPEIQHRYPKMMAFKHGISRRHFGYISSPLVISQFSVAIGSAGEVPVVPVVPWGHRIGWIYRTDFGGAKNWPAKFLDPRLWFFTNLLPRLNFQLDCKGWNPETIPKLFWPQNGGRTADQETLGSKT